MAPTPRPTKRDRIPSRRRTTIATSIVLTALLGVAAPLSASADTTAPEDSSPTRVAAATTAPTATGRVVDYPMQYGWTDQLREFNGPSTGHFVDIGLETRYLSLDVHTEPLGPVSCRFADEFGDQVSITTFTAEEWRSDEPKIASIEPWEYTDIYYLTCTSGNVDEPRWTLKWVMLLSKENIGETVALSDDERGLSATVETDRYTTVDGERQLAAGDVVRVTGAPGTWPVRQRVTVYVESGAPSRYLTVYAYASADGSTVEFTFPTPPTPDYFLANSSIRVSGAFDDKQFDAPSYVKRVAWSQPFTYTASPAPTASPTPTTSPTASPTPTQSPSPTASPAPTTSPTTAPVGSSVTVAVASKYSVSILRMPVTATVTNPDGSRPAGTVSFRVDGKSVGSAKLNADGVAKSTLPKLPRGTYSITATFTPSSGAAAVTSAGTSLRVVR